MGLRGDRSLSPWGASPRGAFEGWRRHQPWPQWASGLQRAVRMTCWWTGSSSSTRSICWCGGSLSSSTCESRPPTPSPAWPPAPVPRICSFYNGEPSLFSLITDSTGQGGGARGGASSQFPCLLVSSSRTWSSARRTWSTSCGAFSTSQVSVGACAALAPAPGTRRQFRLGPVLTLQTGDRQTLGMGPEEESPGRCRLGHVTGGTWARWQGREPHSQCGGVDSCGIRDDKAVTQHKAREQTGLFGPLPLLELVGRSAPTGEGLWAPGPRAAPGARVTADACPEAALGLWPSGQSMAGF